MPQGRPPHRRARLADVVTELLATTDERRAAEAFDEAERRELLAGLASWLNVDVDRLLRVPPDVLDALAAKEQEEPESVTRMQPAAQLHDVVVHLVGRLASEARTDELTGLANRRAAMERLELELERSARIGGPLAVIALDVDRLKHVNDLHGHAAGDDLLRGLAVLLRGSLRASDLVARLGGDEFIVICPETDAAAADHLARKLVTLVRQLEIPGRREINAEMSAGWAVCVPGESDADELLVEADRALYRAKRHRPDHDGAVGERRSRRERADPPRALHPRARRNPATDPTLMRSAPVPPRSEPATPRSEPATPRSEPATLHSEPVTAQLELGGRPITVTISVNAVAEADDALPDSPATADRREPPRRPRHNRRATD